MAFFSTTALRPQSPSFRGREAELTRLLHLCLDEVTRYVALYGGRQNGKTSLLLRLESALQQRASICRVEFQLIQGAAPEVVFAYLATQIAQHLPASTMSEPVRDGPTLQRLLIERLSRTDLQRVVLILDEWGALSPSAREALANVLRSIFHARLVIPALEKLQIVFSGGVELYNLVITEASSLHSICEELYLADLPEPHAVALVSDGLATAGVDTGLGEQLGRAVFAQVAGHPYLTQRMGELLAGYHAASGTLRAADVWRAVEEIRVSGPPLLRRISRDLREYQLEDAARRLLRDQPRFDRLDDDMVRLELVGLAKQDGDRWVPRNRLLAEVFRQRLGVEALPEPPPPPTPAPLEESRSQPTAEIRRQLAVLRQLLTDLFSDGELRTLCFDLGIDYEILPGDGKGDKTRELVAYAVRYSRLPELIARCYALRPRAAWPAFDSDAALSGAAPHSAEAPTQPTDSQPAAVGLAGYSPPTPRHSEPPPTVDEIPDSAVSASNHVLISVQQEALSIVPGQVILLPVEIINNTDQIDDYLITVSGVPQTWVKVLQNKVKLNPGARMNASLTINVPREPESIAKVYPVTIYARSMSQPDQVGAARGQWTIQPFTDTDLTIKPQRARSWRAATYTVTLANRGNSVTRYTLATEDQDNTLGFDLPAEPVTLPPGETWHRRVRVSAPVRLLGGDQPAIFNVRATAEKSRTPNNASATFTHYALLPLWMLGTLIVLIMGIITFLVRPPDITVANLNPQPQVAGATAILRYRVENARSARLEPGDIPITPGRGEYIYPDATNIPPDLRVVAEGWLITRSEREVPVSVVPPTVTPLPTITPLPEPQAPTSPFIATQVLPAPTPLPAWVPEMAEVPAGPFLMGSADSDTLADSDEKPQHEVTLEPYWIGKTEITNAQFRPFVEGDGYTNRAYWTEAGWAWREAENITAPLFWNDPQWNSADQPVVGVSWFEAVAYTRWLSAQTGHEFRLPTEAEWEKAARGTEGLAYPWGNAWDPAKLNSGQTVGRTTPVGEYPGGARPYGALDMAGNAWEWCATVWQKPYPYQIEDEWTEAYLAQDTTRVIRGGAWSSDQKGVRGASRGHYDPRNRFNFQGLRVASRAPVPS